MAAKLSPELPIVGDAGDGAPVELVEVAGSIKWFDASKGYGFIVPDDGQADVLLQVRTLGANPEAGKADTNRLRQGQIVIGMAEPLTELESVATLAKAGVTLFAMELIPRITRAQAMDVLSSNVGRICAPISTFVPMYLMLVMGGVRALKEVWPAALVCGVAFGGMQFVVSNYVGPQLTDIMGSLSAIVALTILLKIWKPEAMTSKHSFGELALAWCPYLFLVICVLLWGDARYGVKPLLESTNAVFNWPGLHNLVQQIPPVVKAPAPYAAKFTFNPLAASGTACLVAVFFSSIVLKYSPAKLIALTGSTIKQLVIPTVTIMAVVGLAYMMNYSGATATLGLAFAATGVAFPFFSALCFQGSSVAPLARCSKRRRWYTPGFFALVVPAVLAVFFVVFFAAITSPDSG